MYEREKCTVQLQFQKKNVFSFFELHLRRSGQPTRCALHAAGVHSKELRVSLLPRAGRTEAPQFCRSCRPDRWLCAADSAVAASALVAAAAAAIVAFCCRCRGRCRRSLSPPIPRLASFATNTCVPGVCCMLKMRCGSAGLSVGSLFLVGFSLHAGF